MGRCHVCEQSNPTHIPALTENTLRVRGLEDLNDGRCLRCVCDAVRWIAAMRKALNLCQYCAGELISDKRECAECGTCFNP